MSLIQGIKSRQIVRQK